MNKLTNENINAFKLRLYEEERSKNTIEKYIRDIKKLAMWLGNKELDKVGLLEYKKYLCENFAPKSVNSMLSSLNSYFTFIGQNDFRLKTLKIQRQIFMDCEKELTKNDYTSLLRIAKRENNDRLYYLMQTIGSTGIRISELKFVTVQALKTGKANINLKGKMRQVFLPEQLCKMLSAYIKKARITEGSIFVTRSGKPVNRSNVWKMLKSLCDKAGVSAKKVFPHNFRHLFARTFYALQRDIVRLADILGHSNINTTRIYTAETGDSHQKQLKMLGLLLC